MEVGKSVAKMMMGLTGLSVPGAEGYHGTPYFGGSANPYLKQGGNHIHRINTALGPLRIIRASYGPVLYHYYKPLTVVARIPRNLPQLYSFLRIEVKSRHCDKQNGDTTFIFTFFSFLA